ncbi:hypothetical protein G5I_02367 [Acromyrmex echinatior]|uniref:Uncharacterized protein n=1 Tax=Acromyrmex echinatior TaxID=103372 RepID=F4WA50_ACREC|nr:hypothetical protein G5I_02367 [Acromyrmex echinatior]
MEWEKDPESFSKKRSTKNLDKAFNMVSHNKFKKVTVTIVKPDTQIWSLIRTFKKHELVTRLVTHIRHLEPKLKSRKSRLSPNSYLELGNNVSEVTNPGIQEESAVENSLDPPVHQGRTPYDLG